MSRKKVEIKVNEVSWNNGNPLKFQAVAIVSNASGFLKRIYGDPADNKTEAIVELRKEVMAWREASNAALEKIDG